MNYEDEMKEFLNYADRYDRTNGMIELKVVHTLRVVEIMDRITAGLALPEVTRYLAALCALFHDIGRFEQVTRYGTYNDRRSVNHAVLSCEVLLENGFLGGLPENHREMILTAIENHNKLAIDEGLDEETALLSKLIRDADKIDIFRVFAEEEMTDTMGETIDMVEQETVSDEVFMAHECIPKDIRRTGLDIWVGFLAFFYDMNFPQSMKIALEEGYYRKQFDNADFSLPETRERVDAILCELETYLCGKRGS